MEKILLENPVENLEEKTPDEEIVDGGLGVLVKKKTLYHGSAVPNIDKFNIAEETTIGNGVYFTSEPDKASGYAERRFEYRSHEKDAGAVVHIRNIENMKLLNLRKKDNLLHIAQGFREILVREQKRENIDWAYEQNIKDTIENIDSGKINHPKDLIDHFPRQFTKYAQSLGYDGVLAIEGGEGAIGDHDTYLIFDPEKLN